MDEIDVTISLVLTDTNCFDTAERENMKVKQTVKQTASKQFCYFCTAEDGAAKGLIKIGCTNNIERRLKAFETKLYTSNVKLLAVMPAPIDGAIALERRLHERFAEYRAYRNEWFTPVPELMDYIARVNGDYSSNITEVAYSIPPEHGRISGYFETQQAITDYHKAMNYAVAVLFHTARYEKRVIAATKGITIYSPSHRSTPVRLHFAAHQEFAPALSATEQKKAA